MSNGVSIVICCYNSAMRLPETIRHIALQEVPTDISWELIVVNNNSTDNTTEVVLNELKKYESLIDKSRIIDENKPGLSHARESGVTSANYEYIIFCDDDNLLSSSYVDLIHSTFTSNKKIGVIGGIGLAATENGNKFPSWFSDYQHLYATGRQNYSIGIINNRPSAVYGAGSAFRKIIFEKLNELNIELFTTDRAGRTLISGGDIELCIWANLFDLKVAWFDTLKFVHVIPHTRLKISYLRRLKYGLGYTTIYHKPYEALFKNESIKFAKLFRQSLNLLIGNIFNKKIINNPIDYYLSINHSLGLVIGTLMHGRGAIKNYEILRRNIHKIVYNVS